MPPDQEINIQFEEITKNLVQYILMIRRHGYIQGFDHTLFTKKSFDGKIFILIVTADDIT